MVFNISQLFFETDGKKRGLGTNLSTRAHIARSQHEQFRRKVNGHHQRHCLKPVSGNVIFLYILGWIRQVKLVLLSLLLLNSFGFRVKAYNNFQLAVFMIEIFDPYMRGRLLDVSLGRSTPRRVMTENTVAHDRIQPTHDPLKFLVTTDVALYEVLGAIL